MARFRDHFVPSKATVANYLILVVVCYHFGLPFVDYKPKDKTIARGFIVAYIYLALLRSLGQIPLMWLSALLAVENQTAPKPRDEEASIAIGEDVEAATAHSVSSGLKTFVAGFILSLSTIPLASVLCIIQNPGSYASVPLLLTGTYAVFRGVFVYFAYAQVGLLLLAAPILFMRHPVVVLTTLHYTSRLCAIVLVYTLALRGTALAPVQTSPIVAHIHWQFITVVSPLAVRLGALVFFLQLLNELAARVKQLLLLRALAAIPALWRKKEGYVAPTWCATLRRYTTALAVPALLILAGSSLQDRGEELALWGRLLGLLALLAAAPVCVDVVVVYILALCAGGASQPLGVLDRMGVMAAVYLLKNSMGETYWTMMERLKEQERELAEKEEEKKKGDEQDPEKAAKEAEEAAAPLIDLGEEQPAKETCALIDLSEEQPAKATSE